MSVLHLQRACLYSALGWALGDAGALRSAQRIWLQHPTWQALRRYAEEALALHDPGECGFALNLLLDGLLRPLLDARALRRCGGEAASALASYFDALMESIPTQYVHADTTAGARWAPRAAGAALPVVEQVWGQETDEKLAAVMESLAVCTRQDVGARGPMSRLA